VAEKGFKHKLTIILSSDVEGHSRIMDENEEPASLTLTTYHTSTSFRLFSP
jgi:hypothetical protein